MDDREKYKKLTEELKTEKYRNLAKKLENAKDKETVKRILSGLTAKEAIALREKYGVVSENSTNLEDIEKQFGVIRKRIHKIEERKK